jgi:hypothetical protein
MAGDPPSVHAPDRDVDGSPATNNWLAFVEQRRDLLLPLVT